MNRHDNIILANDFVVAMRIIPATLYLRARHFQFLSRGDSEGKKTFIYFTVGVTEGGTREQ